MNYGILSKVMLYCFLICMYIIQKKHQLTFYQVDAAIFSDMQIQNMGNLSLILNEVMQQ